LHVFDAGNRRVHHPVPEGPARHRWSEPKENRMRKLALLAAAVAALAAAAPGSAHNAGHVILSDGRCIDVGSGLNAPYVSTSNPHVNTTTDPGRLDLEPGSGDQYGARFAADQGQSAVLPRLCAEVGLTPSN
jgi:hypothetical protein